MRLVKLKIAGFKSFVDPTNVSFPSSLTGVVGPNGCGKSNIIDAVRWVMGEISAKHLRGDSMADVIFNGSSSRKPLGSASVELVFENDAGKIGGQYATYTEIALRRTVSRDGTSDYFINGTKVRRKDITQLFLGTGLGSRSYAIIEQGMISRVIDARPEDLRAFLEEAAGISRYKERRRETENRIGHTRENLERLNDLREEVDKQIRHLQRQAATARRYQSLKDEERRLQAELLVLRLQKLDADAAVQDTELNARELQLQSALANLREVETEIDGLRLAQTDRNETLGVIQGRYYEAGAGVTRIEQSIAHTRQLRERQSADLEEAANQVLELTRLRDRDRAQSVELADQLAALVPQLDQAHADEIRCAQTREDADQALGVWQQTWDAHAAALTGAHGETQVERARIEQLENQERRLLTQRERLQAEHDALSQREPQHSLEALAGAEASARDAGRAAEAALNELLADLTRLREREREQNQALNSVRTRWQQAQGSLVSTEALQQAALGKASGKVTQWLASQSLDTKPRLAQQLRVERGWERAVETVLGSYLEAVCVDGVEDIASVLDSFGGGHLALVTEGRAAQPATSKASRGDVSGAPGILRDSGSGSSEPDTLRDNESGAIEPDTLRDNRPGASEPSTSRDNRPGSSERDTLRGKVSGSSALSAILERVRVAQSLGDALALRAGLRDDESVVTRDGIWMAHDWLRLSRDADAHAGVIEREQVLREVRAEVARLGAEVETLQRELESTRDSVHDLEDRRERSQAEVNRLHRDHVSQRAQLEAAQLRSHEAAQRLEQTSAQLEDIRNELAAADAELHAARSRMQQSIDALAALEPKRVELEGERDRLRDQLSATRNAAQAAQQGARELGLQVESRRSSQASLRVTLERVGQQFDALTRRHDELAAQLADADAPLAALQGDLETALERRVQVEAELRAARIASEELEARLRGRDEVRVGHERSVETHRGALEEARMAAQQFRVRRENLMEQFAATHLELAEVTARLAAETAQPGSDTAQRSPAAAQLGPEARIEAWESQLADTTAKIERLGQVNLAAIGEFKEQSERKEYLDRQLKDLTDALEMLESAMRKIDRETRSRFQDTFDRVNAGLKEKFPRLFGGGHAYLELVGEDTLAGGVSIMARPPGKRNSSISQLSGGEKALTAVALVFAIFDLNPAPFCLLDEVDAPLDDNNVGRFCDIVREMSRAVQFIFITHNKTTMELASQLVGVTMHEPGVSRLVAVDVDEAVRMAAS